MAPVNGRLIFNEIPTGYPEPGKTTIYDESETIDLDNVALKGGILTKTLSLSVDPYLRGKMRDPHIQDYSPAFIKGEPIYNDGISVVIRSEHPSVKPGDHVMANLNFQEYNILSNSKEWRVAQNPENLPWDAFVSILGMPGNTAYAGWHEYAQSKKGDVVFVSAGAGPVGSFVIQLAKAEGLKVISSAGSDDKVKFLKEIGADIAFNYKTRDTAEVLKQEGPIDIYWDNVGGETLDATLAHAASGARIIACGSISGYNGKPTPIRNMGVIVNRQIKIYGFLIFTLWPKYADQFWKDVPKRVAKGEYKYKVDITKELKHAGEALRDVQMGKNQGKSIVQVAEN